MRANILMKVIPGILFGAAMLAGCSSPAEDASVSPTPTPTSSASEFAISDYLDTISVTAADPGPRPLLTWTPVDGAALYLVTVLDSSGIGYWTWEGTATEVHVGGTAEPDAIGPYVFEEMSWMVAAQDDEGTLLAVSEPSPLRP